MPHLDAREDCAGAAGEQPAFTWRFDPEREDFQFVIYRNGLPLFAAVSQGFAAMGCAALNLMLDSLRDLTQPFARKI
jgi:hypothetical protein